MMTCFSEEMTQSLTEEKKGWDISPRRGEATSGEIKIPHESRKAHSHSCAKSQFFRTAWLSRRGEKKVPTTSGEATSGRNFFFTTSLLSHKWGKIVTCTGMRMCLEWRMENFTQSLFLLGEGLTFPYCTQNFWISILHTWGIDIAWFQFSTVETISIPHTWGIDQFLIVEQWGIECHMSIPKNVWNLPSSGGM